jgi:ATP-dependent exoDNAse (exonuclease V) beta subunit
MTDLLALDSRARAEAVRPDGSFIVQAPAGSGKTSLLTQRFLRLLAEVERPEEIVAITFTRKAAAEMRHRVISALAAAAVPLPAEAGEHERLTRELARQALDNGRRRGWDLARQPSRLHIQTIDGLNHWLAGRLPLSARLGLSPQLVDDARLLYGEAARQFVARLEDEAPPGGPIAHLARLLDHDPGQLGDLLAEMLGRREIWLPKLYELREGGDPRRIMEQWLAAASEAALARIRTRLDVPVLHGIVGQLREASRRDPQGPLAPLAAGTGLPGATLVHREAWECIARSVLTAQGDVRRSLDKRVGFTPDMKAEKGELLARFAEVAGQEPLVEALEEIRFLPPARYEDAQWDRVAALVEVLVPAAAELQALFAERGLADHAAVAAAARQALGDDDAPSELALALDYRIRHLLVDEYQDTSPVQQTLLQRLVAGWQPGDGHSLFCVGDPMQSIYGFREADVTLFLEAQKGGIGDVALQPQSLSRNFRSCHAVVEWVNEAFAGVMPERPDYQRGAVPYTASAATRDDEPDAGVTVHPILGRDEQREVATIARVVEQSLAEIEALETAGEEGSAGGCRSIAVLVRARTSLPPLLAELRRRGIAYRGVELESLGERAAVRDVLALARALLHPGDRTAWLAVLRAPWCGLTLGDLHALVAGEEHGLLLSLCQDPARLGGLTVEGRERVARVMPGLLESRSDHGRQSLGSWVRSCWIALGGPATLEDPGDLDNVESCFSALDQLAIETGPTPASSEVESAVDGLMASPTGSEGARVQLMTIHKAKGLEFDTVILPGLEKTVASNSRRLLYWTQVPVEDGTRGIVLASRGDDSEGSRGDALESWMRRLEAERADLELGRLAYVAATRARRRLHLVGAVQFGPDNEGQVRVQEPRKGSMLGLLWGVLAPHFHAAAHREEAPASNEEAAGPRRPRRSAPPPRRLPLTLTLPPAPEGVRPSPTKRMQASEVSVRPAFEWAGAEAIAVGTVVHMELERLARAGKATSSLEPQPEAWNDALRRLRLPADRLPGAMARVSEALQRVACSDTAARLLDPGARESASEFSLTAWLDGEFATVKIDRTFVDEAGVRWIVDWKTGSHEGADIERFLEQEIERYSPQLERYSRVMALYDPRPQCVGLYFPLLDRWKAWRA